MGLKCRGMWKKPPGQNEHHAKNTVLMNVVRNIFLYFEIIRKTKNKNTMWAKSCQKNTTKGMFLLIYKFFA